MRAFRCSRTGVLFPDNYIEDWGKNYGIGLGSVPVSEALVNDYHRSPVGEGDTGMHALSVCRAQVDLVDVSEEEYLNNLAIIDADDPGMRLRAPLMRAKQLVKSSVMQNKFPHDVARAKTYLADLAAARTLKYKSAAGESSNEE